jgi:WD40 repeat protein
MEYMPLKFYLYQSVRILSSLFTIYNASMKKTALMVGIALLAVASAWAQQKGIPRIVINAMGHTGKIQNLVFTPDGERIISVSEDKSIREWSLKTGQMLRKFEVESADGWEGMLYASAISPDGQMLAVAGYPVPTKGDEKYIALIDLAAGKQVGTGYGHTNVIYSLDFSGRGDLLASGSQDGTVIVWKLDEKKQLKQAATISVGGPVRSLSVNPVTGDLAVAVLGDPDVKVYPLSNIQKGISKWTPRLLKKHKGAVNKVEYSQDGVYLASGSIQKEVLVWEMDGSIVESLEMEDEVTALAFSHDSKFVVAFDNQGHGASFNLRGHKEADYAGHDNTVFSACFSPVESGSYNVASAGGTNNEIIVWNPINGRTSQRIKGKGKAIERLQFGKDLQFWAANSLSMQGNKQSWDYSFDLATMRVLEAGDDAPVVPKPILNLTQSSEYILDLPKGKAILNSPDVDGRILTYLVTPANQVVVGSDFSLKMYDLNGHLMKEFIGHSGGVRTASVSADGRFLITGGEDQIVNVWLLNETGSAWSVRQHEVFNDENWAGYFSSLPFDSLTKIPSKKAWLDLIQQLKATGDKATWRALEAEYKNLGEIMSPFATLFVADDREWVCWTPKGYFSCTSKGSNYFGWHINQGVESLSEYYSADQYFDLLYRPEQIQKSMVQAKRVEQILTAEGEHIFDLAALGKPSAVLFQQLAGEDYQYEDGWLTTKAKTITFSVDVFDGGGGVKELNIYQNDKLIINDKQVKTKGAGDRITKTYTVDVLNGENRFRAVAINYNRIESKPQFLLIKYTGEVMATSSLNIFSIGINKYLNSAYNLNYAAPDALSFVEAITDAKSAGLYKSINKFELYDEQATKENILKKFIEVQAKAKPEDVFIFYYAGHGSLDVNKKNERGENPFYFVPYDVTQLYGDSKQLITKGLSTEELSANLMAIRSTKQIVLMDACHSGGAVTGIKMRAAAGEEKAMVQLGRSSGVAVIASSGSKQLAAEFEVLKHGVFTYALLEALSGRAANGDTDVTITELKTYMDKRVPELTKIHGGEAQFPTGFVNGNDYPILVINPN